MKRMTYLGILLSIIILAGVSSANAVILEVDIDIKPGSFPNSINLTNNGIIPVAILTTDAFDATTIDFTTVLFGPAGAAMIHRKAHMEDVDEDGDLDLVFHFYTQETGLFCGDTEAYLTGETLIGEPIEGDGEVNIVVCD